MIRAVSRHALAQLRPHVEAQTARLSIAALTEVAQQLYAVTQLLESAPRLRRLVGDPASTDDARTHLVTRLFEGKMAPATLSIVQAAAALRWSSPWDLSDGIEGSGDEVLLGAAERDRSLDEVEDELFRFERILDAQPELVSLFDDMSVPAERRTALLRDVLFGRVHPVTQALLEHAVESPRRRSVERAIDALLQAAAARRERSVARVLSAVPVSQAQQQRLEATLSRMYGRAIAARVAVDPSVRGGLVIRIGDDLIDGSVAGRFASARAALAVT